MSNIFSGFKGYLDRIGPLSTEQKADPVILEKIRNGDKSQLGAIYKAYQSEFIGWLTNQYNCSHEDARDAYQFAIIALYDNIQNNKLNELNSSLKTYLFAIGKHKILEGHKASVRFVEKEEESIKNIPEVNRWEEELHEESLQLVEECLEKLGEPCKTLLELYYFHNMSMDEIAQKMSYRNRQTSKNLKYKCINRLRRIYMEELKKLKNQGIKLS